MMRPLARMRFEGEAAEPASGDLMSGSWRHARHGNPVFGTG